VQDDSDRFQGALAGCLRCHVESKPHELVAIDIWTFDRVTINLMVRLPPIARLFDDILADLAERCWIPIEVQIEP
jgi:hypothetical protein